MLNAVSHGCMRCCFDLLWQAGRRYGQADTLAIHMAESFNQFDCVRLLAPFEAELQDGIGGALLAKIPFGHKNQQGIFECLRELLKCRRQIEQCVVTPLMIHAMRGDETGVRENLDLARRQDVSGHTALMYAAALGHASVVEVLAPLEAGIFDGSQMTALKHAVVLHKINIVELLSPYEAAMSQTDRMSPLIAAVLSRDVELARALLPHGAGSRNSNGFTSLMLATQQNNLELVRLLIPLEGGLVGPDGSAAEIALSKLNAEGAALLLADPKELAVVPTPLVAAFRGDIRTLLDLQQLWGEPFDYRLTMLHAAITGRQLRALEILTARETHKEAFSRLIDTPLNLRALPARLLSTVAQIIARKQPADTAAQLYATLGDGPAGFRAGVFLPPYPTRSFIARVPQYDTPSGISTLSRALRNLGLVVGDKTLFDALLDRDAMKAFDDNPILAKQIELAHFQCLKLSELGIRDLPAEHQFAVCERRLEATYNCCTLGNARDAMWGAISQGRRVDHRKRHTVLYGKQERLGVLLRETYRFMVAQVREMLED